MNIVLCGFMGAGKTTAGRLLAARLQRPFLDIDAQIERDTGLTVSALFARYGEAHFRALERQAVAGAGKREGLVIATGGGALLDPANVAALRPNALFVFLDAPLERIRARLAGDNARPLLQDGNGEERLKALFEARRPAYLALADAVIDAGRDLDHVVNDMIQINAQCTMHNA